MKICSACKLKLPTAAFHKRTRAKDGLQSRCAECNKKQRKAHYHTAHGRGQKVLTGQRWRSRQRELLYLYLLDHPCVDCGEDDPVVLDFDHRDGKEFGICKSERGWKAILAEIAKCDVRCANCHRRKTARDFGWYKHMRKTTALSSVG